MFSQQSQSPAATRTNRRRPRPTSGEHLPKAKRQRNTINGDTSPVITAKSAINTDHIPNRSTTVARRESIRSNGLPRRELSMRSKKSKIADRPALGDGGTVLTKNDVYSVHKLPAWPERLQIDHTVRHHGAIYSDFGFALSLSHEHALIWPYNAHTSTPETFTFVLPGHANPATDPLPLGCLVAPPTGFSEPGLVVVVPSSGKIIYWESIASAATSDLAQQQRHAVSFSISGTFFGEIATQILNAQSAGFVLSFSSGRIAYLSVRDNQSKPAISLQFLRSGAGSTSSGIFGSLRNALQGSAVKGNLAACRAGTILNPGERRIGTATTKGRVQIWDLHRGGHNILLADAELREPIFKALAKTKDDLVGSSIDSFEVHDFAFLPAPIDEAGQTILVLTSIAVTTDADLVTHFAVVKINLSQSVSEIGEVRHLRCYTENSGCTTISKPRLYLPMPAFLAFVVFDRSIVVVSIVESKQSPSSQLRQESHVFPDHYEDVVDLRHDTGFEIVGSGTEEPQESFHSLDDIKTRRHRSKHAAVVLIVRGVGIVRITALENKIIEQKPPVLTAKSKLEQAVFFGTQNNNPLSFAGRDEISFPIEEIQAAALALSEEIVTSASSYIPSTAISVEQHLRQRQSALRELANHLLKMKIPIDRRTRWILLTMAEKIAAASKCWSSYDAQLRLKSEDSQPILQDIVLNISEDQKTDIEEEVGELDRVRHWFIHDINHIDVALTWAWEVFRRDSRDNSSDYGFMIRRCSQAVDTMLGSLKTAFTFREENLALYRLEHETLSNGVLFSTEDYNQLPTFWTSTPTLAKCFDKLCNALLTMAHPDWESEREGVDIEIVRSLRSQAPDMVDFNTRIATEKYRWMLGQDGEVPDFASSAVRTSIRMREIQIAKLADMGSVQDAIKVAVKHKVFSTLASLLVEELFESAQTLEYIAKGGTLENENHDSARAHLQDIEDQITLYIRRFAKDFSYALYKCYLEQGMLYTLIDDKTGKNIHLSEFLQQNPDLSKLTWINEVKNARDYDKASHALFEMARTAEPNAWSKKVEYSIGKLVRLSGKNYSQKDGFLLPDGGRAELRTIDGELESLGLQEAAHQYVASAVGGAIDENAELELTREVFASNKSLDDKDALRSILSDRLSQLVGHEAMTPYELVDLLTLINARKDGTPIGLGHFGGQEFYMALKALRAFEQTTSIVVNQTEHSDIQKIIWRRCMLHDDWAQLNDTSIRTDRDVKDRLHDTALYSTLRACVKDGMFESTTSNIRPFTPSECLSAGTTYDQSRYAASGDSVGERVREDEAKASSDLQHYISKCQLEKWHNATLDEAKQKATTDVEKKAESGTMMKDIAKELEAMETKIAEDCRVASKTSLKGLARTHRA